MKKITMAAVIVALLPNLSFAINDAFKPRASTSDMRPDTRGDKPREHVIDAYRQDRLKHKDAFYSGCKKKEFSNAYLEMDCYKDAGKKYRAEYPDRGTHEYGEKFYSVLSPEEGRIKRDELLKLLDLVSYYPKLGNEETELTVKHIRQEMHYLERYVMKINPRYYETR